MRQKPRILPQFSQMELAFIGHTRERLCRENELILPKRRQSSKTVASHAKTILWFGIKVTRIFARCSVAILLPAALPVDHAIRLLYFLRSKLSKVVQCGLALLVIQYPVPDAFPAF